MSNWTRKPQEVEGDYFFSGKAVMTVGVELTTTMLADVIPITMDLNQAVKENNGLDYLQVYECDDGRVVWVIDQLSKSMREAVTTHRSKSRNMITGQYCFHQNIEVWPVATKSRAYYTLGVFKFLSRAPDRCVGR